jgi:hypothetical protein
MSTLRVTNVQDTAGANSSTTAEIKNGIAKAWVNFNGTGTVAIRASFNTSSITDNGAGEYTVNFATALADANYCPQGSCNGVFGTSHQPHFFGTGGSIANFTTTSLQFIIEQGGAVPQDREVISVAIFR